MIDFVGISPFVGITLWVAMATMHFHMAQTDLCFKNIFFLHLGGLSEQFGTNEKLSRRCNVCQIRCQVKVYSHF